ncbi:leucine-rich repeat-containing protein (LRR) [Tieghemostelium lacteum]|uniref:Leucine-rich repeat and WD repeat-containing protein 1 n=1 Tax=Tieghemostelium lacteum TaxID=361077 RepID=A0A152A9C4_TIELA|nr:leucine-rich repeat-containing protein (LRR) [Tieghemostelium lacteum]|eukprot:KYR02814.1 leucine-rich repeat-containing protein (LRR) [Tieghemostelium lacteum]
MEILNLTIEFHSPEGTINKKIVRVDHNTKIGEVMRLLLEKFGRSNDIDASLYQLYHNTNSNSNNINNNNMNAAVGSTSVIQLTDTNKTLSGYNIKNNDELVFKKRQKKSNPSQAKLSNKSSIFKTLFSMSTIEFKLGEEKTQSDILEVENQIEDPILLFKAIEYLSKHFSVGDHEEILSSFQYVGNESEYSEFLRTVQQNERDVDFSSYKNPVKLLCNFILNSLQVSFSQTSLTTLLKPSTPLESKASIFYDMHPKNRVILKHIMIFLANLTSGDATLLDTVASIIAPLVIGSQTPPMRSATIASGIDHYMLSGSGGIAGGSSTGTQNQLAESLGQHNPLPPQPTTPPLRNLSQEEIQFCKKVVIDLIQNIQIYLLFSPQRGVLQLPGETILFTTENIYCIDKCNYPPSSKAHLGELWVTNYRIIFVNSPNSSHSTIPHSTSSSLSSSSQLAFSTSSLSNSTHLPASMSSSSLSSYQMANYIGVSSSSLQYGGNLNTSNMTNVSSVPSNNSTTQNILSTFENTEIPITTIYRWKSIKSGPLFEAFKIYCKDFRCKVIGIPHQSAFKQKFKELLESVKTQSFEAFAFASKEHHLQPTENYSEQLLVQEYNRMGLSWDHWRLTQVNSAQEFPLCEAYPLQSVVPKSIIDNHLVISAYYRKSFRFPVLAWSHPVQRSSITRASPPDDTSTNSASSSNLLGMNPIASPSGILNNNSSSSSQTTSTNVSTPTTPRELYAQGHSQSFVRDNQGTPINSVKSQQSSSASLMSPNGGMVQVSSTFTSPTGPLSPRLQSSISFTQIGPEVNNCDIELLKGILDIKPSNMLIVFDAGQPSAYANTMIGCQIDFLRLPTLSDTKDSFNKLLHLHLSHPDKKWQEVIKFHWLQPMSNILLASINIATNVEQGRSVLIQSVSPDVDAQLSSLAQLLLDPYYRTIDGFKVLIEKEWICYGHPFSKRSNYRSVNKFDQVADGFSPIFMQFLNIVWQIWKEFPTSFQFNENYLITLCDNIYSGRFGTFLMNTVKERESSGVYTNTKSFWSYVDCNRERFMNAYFNKDSNSGLLKCSRHFQDTMWNEYFYRFCFKSSIANEQLEERIKSAMMTSGVSIIGESAGKIVPLDTLDCSNLRLFYLSLNSALYQFSATLKDLNLQKNNLNSIPLSLCELRHLEKLSLEENNLTSFPNETIKLFSQNLKNLQELNLANNQFTDLPQELSLFAKQLKILSLRKNPFINIPTVVVESLSSLENLDLSECEFSQVSAVPLSHHSLLNLKTLTLSNTNLTTLPKEIGEFQKLEQLYLDQMQLVALPPTFGQLTHMQELTLSNNQLTEFPMEITNLTQLRKLNLENNQISMLPNDISQLIHLTVLNLKQNRLESLPASIGQLHSLVELNLINNQLTQLRPTMGLLENLSLLKLDGNRLKTPPAEILAMGLKSILDYLKDLIKGSESCFKMKLMIVGQENVGKTTLIKTLKEKKKKPTLTQNISTDGISIDSWVFQGTFEELDENNKPVKRKQDVTLSIWDFAGQDIYYTTHQFFLSERSVYIIAWNIILAEEESRVEFWLQSITSRAKDVPIIIVGTHLDDSNRSVAKTLKKKIKDKYSTRFPNIKAIKLVSCVTGKGINSLRETLESIVVQQRNMGEALPRSYMLLENIVKEETKKRIIPTISWPEFIQLGQICTITDENELLRATMFLNQLGSLVYFPKETGLRQFVILDPQWITNMLSSIITTKHSYAKDGILYHKNFKQIWRPPLYPQNLHTHLLALLEKFEISYSLTNASGNTVSNFEDGISLIPSLLGDDRPSSFDSYWKPYNSNVDQFGRIYVLEFVPNGFFSRLMVRILNFARAEAKCYWKNGMILQRDQEQILLEMNNTKKTLSFTVRGSNSVMLSRDITETIQSLLDDSFNLISLIYVPCIHCIQLGSHHPYKFPIEVCENAAVKGIGFLKCQNLSLVRTDLLVPDLVMSNFTGEKIPYDQLQIEGLIGEGGAALVYRAKYKGKDVAVKRLKTVDGTSGSDQPTDINDITLSKAFNEFRRECWVMSNLEHPNIVQLRGLCLDPLCIVTEYLPQGNLYNFLHKEGCKFSWVFRLKVALDISSGMAFLHSSTPPIIHRDLKSPNILLASLDESSSTLAKVVDFGLSGLQHTITNRGVENPLWLAPEILSKNRDYSSSSDVYAFGVILWELLTCRDYFSEISFMTIVEEKVINGERPQIPEDCNPLYAQLIRDCWQQDPDLRPKFSQIEETILEIVETMFPDLYLSEPNNQKEKRKSLTSSLTKHKKRPSLSSEISDTDVSTYDTSTTNTTTTTTYVQTENIHTNNVQDINNNNNNGSIKNSNSLDTIVNSASNLETIMKQQISSGATSSTSLGHKEEEKDKSTLEILEEIQNMQTPSKRLLYMNHSNKRNSISIQPYYNEFNKELSPNEGTIQCLIQVGSCVWAGTGNGIISVWKTETGEKVKSFRAHPRRIHCLYSHMNTVWSGSADNTINIWNADTFSLMKTFSGNGPTCFTRVGHTIWAGSILNCINVYDIKKKIKHKSKIQLDTGPVECMLRKDQEVWVSLGHQLARIDINSLRVVQMINAHDKAIHAMIQVENTVWTCSSDGFIKVWSTSGQQLAKIQAHSSRIFTMVLVGDYVWSGSWDCSIKIWSIKDYQMVSENTVKHKDAISSFVYIDNSTTTTSQPIPISKKDSKKDKKDRAESIASTPPQFIDINNPNGHNLLSGKRQVWSGSFDSSICIWNLPHSNSYNYLEDLLSDSATITSSASMQDFTTTTTTTTTSSSVPNSSVLTSASFQPSYLNDLSPMPSPNGGGYSTLGRHARRTVSFVLDKFNKK